MPQIRSIVGETRAIPPSAWAREKEFQIGGHSDRMSRLHCAKIPEKHFNESRCGLSTGSTAIPSDHR
jgi:hypothetical protein